MPRPKLDTPNFELKRIKSRKYESGYLPNFYITWTEDGKPKRTSTGTEIEEEAKRILEDFKETYLAPEQEELVLNYIFDEYLKYKKIKYQQTNKSMRNHAGLEYKLTSPRQYFGHMHLEKVTRRMGRDYDTWRRKVHRKKFDDSGSQKEYKPISNATIRMEGAIVNAALNYARKEGWTDKLVQIELPQDAPPRERRLSSEEKRRLIEACVSHHVKLFVIIALTTAKRKTAILELKWSQVDFERRIINFTPKGHYQTNKRRGAVPINDLLLEHLVTSKKMAESDYVIEWKGNKVNEILISFKRTCKKAGLTDVSPHTLRHTAASNMAEKGIPMQEIAAVLGDSIRTVEKHYLKYSPDYLSNAVNALGEL